MGKRPKFIEPMLSEATSGLKVAAGFTRSSIDMVGAPPVVMLITTLERCLITLGNGAANDDFARLRHVRFPKTLLIPPLPGEGGRERSERPVGVAARGNTPPR